MGAAILGVVAVSAVWVYLDASALRIGRVEGERGFLNVSAGAWGVATLLLWIVALPAYLANRKQLEQRALTAPRESPGRTVKAIVLGAFGAVLVASQVAASRPAPAPIAPVAARAPARPAPQPKPVVQPSQPTLLDQIMAMDTLPEALYVLRPLLTDAIDEPSTGAAALALWATGKMRWSDVGVRKNETTAGKVKKDSSTEVGKRMCVSGSIVEIERSGTPEKLYEGRLFSNAGDVFTFAAVQDTGELVQHSYARFCGVVAGQFSYANVAGGQTKSVYLVGMFDLPRNR